MQFGIDYSGSVSDQIQQFVVGRQSVHIPSHIFSTFDNSHDFLGPQIKQLMHQQLPQQSGRLQPVRRLALQSPDAPENHNSLGPSLKQKAQTVDERCPDEDIDAVGERGERSSEAQRWPREETLALLRIRAAICTNSRDSNVKGPVWETVSRKLAELGFHRSAKKCKEKFENVNKYYKKTKDGRISRQDGKRYRFCSEIESLYAGASVKNGGIEKDANSGAYNDANIGNQGVVRNCSSVLINNNINQLQEKTTIPRSAETIDNTRQNLSSDGISTEEELGKFQSGPQINRKRRKMKQSSSCIKDVLESTIKRLMELQENSQKRFLEAVEKTDQNRLIREEAWRRQEMARLNRETELRAQEHALQSSREKAIIEFLEKLASQNFKLSPQSIPIQSVPNAQENDNNTARGKLELHSKRWPKPEVYALIKFRSEMDQRFKESGPKAALWEEISSAMACMGFHRSAKRCKEKWENINKYFRKTKGRMKKRPLSSKTCPYFHHLDTLYAKGVFLSPNHRKSDNKLENQSNTEALTSIDGDDGDQERGRELKANDLGPELLAIAAASIQGAVQSTGTSSETMDCLAQKMMTWNPNLIQTMDDQAVSVKRRQQQQRQKSYDGKNSPGIVRNTATESIPEIP